jgi:predicted ester cyclase
MTEDMRRRSFLGYSAAVAAISGSGGIPLIAEAAEETPDPAGGVKSSVEANKKMAKELYRLGDTGQSPPFEEFHTPNASYHGANHTGFENLTPAEMGKAFYTAFPDFTHVIVEQIGEGDIVVERIRYFATHLGEFMGIPPTGRTITYTGMDWVRFENGKIAERWGVANEFDLRRQLLGQPDPYQTQTNKTLAHEYYDVIDRDGIPAGRPYGGKNSLYHGANHSGLEAGGTAGFVSRIFAAFPDFRHAILDQVADGDIVVERIRYFMTHKGPFMGIEATGKPVTYTGMDWVRFENGIAVERWGVPGSLGLRRQLLGLPDPHPEQTKADLAEDYAAVTGRFGRAAGASFKTIDPSLP